VPGLKNGDVDLAREHRSEALIGAALIGLSWLGELPWWVTAVILGRELGVTLLRMWVIRYGVIAASRGEFVVRAAAVERLGLAALHRINQGLLPQARPMPGRMFAGASPSAAPAATASSSVTYQINARTADFTVRDLEVLQRRQEALARVGRPR
jgi:hypothetical protein